MKLKGRTPMMIGLIGMVAVLGLVVALILPKASQIRGRQKDIQAAEQKQRTLQLRVQELKGLQEQAPRDRRRLAALQSEVPETAQLPSVIDMLNDAADKAALDFLSVAPGTPTSDPTQPVSSFSTDITVSGGYFSVDEFLYRLERLSRVAKVTNVAMQPGGTTQGSNTLSLNLTVSFYTTDLSAGPGSSPGHTGGSLVGATVPGQASASPSPSPSTGV